MWILRPTPLESTKENNKTQTLLSQKTTARPISHKKISSETLSSISNVRQSFQASRHVGPVWNPGEVASSHILMNTFSHDKLSCCGDKIINKISFLEIL